MTSFKSYPFLKRLEESTRIIQKYPDRIPVIVEKGPGKDTPDLDKKKYLVPKDITVGQFVYILRKRINMSAEKAMFIFVENIIPQTSITLNVLYNQYAQDDKFLYITYTTENTFGNYTLPK